MSGPTAMILTHWFDPIADAVVEELNGRGFPVFRCDAADFPGKLTMTANLDDAHVTGTLRTQHRMVSLGDVSGIYYRRPTEFELAKGMSGPEREWAASEARRGFGGLLASLRCWLNHPHRIAEAEYKPAQLRRAAEAGLLTPRTLLTNSPAEARAFAETVGDVIYKPMTPNGIAEGGHHRMLYATRLQADDCDHPGVALTANLFQEWVEHDYAVRLTVVDHRMFSVAMYARSIEAHTDWRSDYDALEYEVIDIPEWVRRGVSKLMQTLGLRFGGLDFLVTPQGDWKFLEINPNGQWAWIDELTPAIASAIADALTKG